MNQILIFLDIELGEDNSILDFLEKIPPKLRTFKVIFTTLHRSKYIKKAFTFSDNHFLDKTHSVRRAGISDKTILPEKEKQMN